MKHLFPAAILAAVLPALAPAAPVTVDYIEAFRPPAVSLPYLLQSGDSTVYLRFGVPDSALLGSLNSLKITVNLFDDGDVDGETGEVRFAPVSLNLAVTSFGPDLNGSTAGSQAMAMGVLAPGDLAAALLTIQDNGRFLVAVNRTGGDFSVAGASVEIDANYIPEPATLVLAAPALLFAFRLRRAR